MNKYMSSNSDKTYYEVSTMTAYELYEVLCNKMSFGRMIELYKLIKHKIEYLNDEPRMEKKCCMEDKNE